MQGIVLTGATSMLGVSLIEECIRNNTRVLAIVRPNSSNLSRLPSSNLINVVECNLSELANINIQGVKDYVFYHFGWQGTDKIQRFNNEIQLENVKYTLDAVGLAHKLGCGVFVGAGSQAEYGRVSCKLSVDTPINPDSAYGIAKYAASKLSAIGARDLGMKHIWTRILSVYGAYDGENTMIMSSIKQLLMRQRPQYTKGEQMWDYLHSDDAARAFYLMGKKPIDQAIYCLGSGKVRRIYEYITAIRDAIDPSLEIGLGELEYQNNQVMYLCADIANLTKDTGFVPEIDFDRGIEKTVKWCKEKMKK